MYKTGNIETDLRAREKRSTILQTKKKGPELVGAFQYNHRSVRGATACKIVYIKRSV